LFRFLDTETTGIAGKDRLYQLAYKLKISKIVNELFKPPLLLGIIWNRDEFQKISNAIDD